MHTLPTRMRRLKGPTAQDQGHVDCLLFVSLNSHTISRKFHGSLLDPHLSAHFSSPFSTSWTTLFPAPTQLGTSSLLNSSTSPNSCATPQRCLLFDRLTEQSPLTCYESKSLNEISSVHTPMNHTSRKNSFDTDFSDLATTVAATEKNDATEVGQLTSPLFSQER